MSLGCWVIVHPAGGYPVDSPRSEADPELSLTASWQDGAALSAGERTGARLSASGDAVRRGFALTATFSGAVVVAVPEGCRHPTTVHTRSWISADGSRLTCWVRARSGSEAVNVDVVADRASDETRATIAAAGAAGTTLTPRPVQPADPDEPQTLPLLRLVSSPDFLNADVADLATGKARWTPSTSTNSTNADYEAALATVLGSWAALRPDLVLVAGDLVDGRWGYDDQSTGAFGPVDTAQHRRRAVRRAARTYYPAWSARFRAHQLRVYPAPGDHEYGDDPWGRTELALTDTFRAEFAREFTVRPDGRPRFAVRPRGTPHEFTAYAWRPHPDVQLVTLDVFDTAPDGMHARLDRGQLRWLRGVLRRARADGVRWTILQGHTPIIGPVRVRSSSGLRYEGGRHSPLWHTMRRFGVDLYLCGEVHDVTAISRDGIAQISHGGLFQFAMSNFLLADVRRGRIDLTLRDFDADAEDLGPRLWETRRSGMPASLHYAPDPWIIGTAALRGDGALAERSGALAPYRP